MSADNIIENILDNIDQYGVDELVSALRQSGIKSAEEFISKAREAGVPLKKSLKDALSAKFAGSEDDDWKRAQAEGSEEAFQKYLDDYPKGKYRDEARKGKEEAGKRMEEVRKRESMNAAEEIWNDVDKNNISSLQDFISAYPESPHCREARRIIMDLRRDGYLGVGIEALDKQIKNIKTNIRINNPEGAIADLIENYIRSGKITVNQFLDAVADDNNMISGSVAYTLWENGIITDFAGTGVDSAFIEHMMARIPAEIFPAARPMNGITKEECTEVYFWGIPSSGKSCALGAILSAANNGKVATSMQKDNNCQGYGYMHRLSNLFKKNGEVSTLPEGNPTSATYEMGFILNDTDGKEHPITCVDLAGELVRCMFKKDAGELLTDEEQGVLQTLTDTLVDNRTGNRKMHFFVIEYGAEDRQYEGLPQSVYLDAAVQYISRTGIFRKDTDGLYILITKVDKAKAHGADLKERLRSYIRDNYQSFYNGLEKICKDNEINRGVVQILPFTLGTVCFQNYCKFDDTTANNVVRILLERSYGYKPGKMRNIFRGLKK